MDGRGARAHDQHPVKQFVTASVVGQPIQILDGELLTRSGPGGFVSHGNHRASKVSWRPTLQEALTLLGARARIALQVHARSVVGFRSVSLLAELAWAAFMDLASMPASESAPVSALCAWAT